MKKSYRAIPVLVYIPTDSLFDPETAIRNAIKRKVSSAEVFMAEDFQNGKIELEEGKELSACISDVCPPV